MLVRRQTDGLSKIPLVRQFAENMREMEYADWLASHGGVPRIWTGNFKKSRTARSISVVLDDECRSRVSRYGPRQTSDNGSGLALEVLVRDRKRLNRIKTTGGTPTEGVPSGDSGFLSDRRIGEVTQDALSRGGAKMRLQNGSNTFARSPLSNLHFVLCPSPIRSFKYLAALTNTKELQP